MVRTFIADHDLSDKAGLAAAAQLRGELYRRLAHAIWGRPALDLPPGPAEHGEDAEVGTARNEVEPPPRRRRTELALLVDGGVVTPGSRVTGAVAGVDVWATVEADGGLRLDSGAHFGKVDDAARAVTGKRSAGMNFWHVLGENNRRVKLRALRDAQRKARSAGARTSSSASGQE